MGKKILGGVFMLLFGGFFLLFSWRKEADFLNKLPNNVGVRHELFQLHFWNSFFVLSTFTFWWVFILCL
jgi:hypothetical protein